MPTIRSLREARGMTQDELARQLGVTVQTVNGWERAAYGGWAPPLTSQIAIAAILGIDRSEIDFRGDPGRKRGGFPRGQRKRKRPAPAAPQEE